MTREEMLSYTIEDINKMTKSELLELARSERKAIKNARYRQKHSDIMDSAAMRNLEETGNISAKESMTVNQLREQVARGRVILNYQTLYVGDARKVQEKMISQMSERLGHELTPKESKQMWDIIAKVREENPALLNTPNLNYIPKETQQRVYDVMMKYQQQVRSESKSGRMRMTKRRMNELYNIITDALKFDYMERENGRGMDGIEDGEEWEELF